MNIPGTRDFVRIARDVLLVHLTIHPTQDFIFLGLGRDAREQPLRDDSRRKLVARLDRDLAALRSMPWRSWPIDRQIDFRLIYAQATEMQHDEAQKSSRLGARLPAAQSIRSFANIGRHDYDWRLRNYYIVPWDAATILRMANDSLARVEARIRALHRSNVLHTVCAPGAFEASGLLRSAIEANVAAVRKSGFVSVPRDLGGVNIAEAGTYGDLMSNHGMVHPAVSFGKPEALWLLAFPKSARDRCKYQWAAKHYRESPLGYAIAHETVPGHHLQSAVVRHNPNPLRKFFVVDDFHGEGWALYAESLALRSGALGPSDDAKYFVFEALRRRILRVMYDVHLQDGSWSIERTRAFRRAHHGEADLEGNADELWYAQAQPLGLVRYFVGKTQLDELHDAYKRKLGPKFTERAFNDAVLAEGLIPIALVRAKLLGEAVPGI